MILPAAGAVIEIFEDHARVEQRRAVLQHQHRNLADRICCRSGSLSSLVSAASILMSPDKPSTLAASLTLRPNGEGGVERRIIMCVVLRGWFHETNTVSRAKTTERGMDVSLS